MKVVSLLITLMISTRLVLVLKLFLHTVHSGFICGMWLSFGRWWKGKMLCYNEPVSWVLDGSSLGLGQYFCLMCDRVIEMDWSWIHPSLEASWALRKSQKVRIWLNTTYLGQNLQTAEISSHANRVTSLPASSQQNIMFWLCCENQAPSVGRVR